jgi:hypothetical protein
MCLMYPWVYDDAADPGTRREVKPRVEPRQKIEVAVLRSETAISQPNHFMLANLLATIVFCRSYCNSLIHDTSRPGRADLESEDVSYDSSCTSK